MTLTYEYVIIISIISALGLILGSLSSIIAVMALIEIKALKATTHSVQMVPVDPVVDAHNEQMLKNWATTDDTLGKQRELQKEDLQDNLNEFYEEESEIISF